MIGKTGDLSRHLGRARLPVDRGSVPARIDLAGIVDLEPSARIRGLEPHPRARLGSVAWRGSTQLDRPPGADRARPAGPGACLGAVSNSDAHARWTAPRIHRVPSRASANGRIGEL